MDAGSQILIVTGYSGAGKSSVLHALEDIGFLCVDNLVIPLLEHFFQLVMDGTVTAGKVALGLDVRSGSNIDELVGELHRLIGRWPGSVKILFVVSSHGVLLKRFQETRRKHPLADTLHLSDAIAHESALLAPLHEIADVIFDTDQLTIHQLRSLVTGAFADNAKQVLTVSLVSFGFKYGIPLESNFVYDLRCLPNPYFIPELKHKNGTDQIVVDYLFEHAQVQEYWQKLRAFITYAVSNQEQRFFWTISLGCTGGRHRSVAFVHMLANQQIDGVQFLVKHRDIARDIY